ncbi:surface antigen BspA-like [Trichomonas vaginalis G3]|uniref:Surface antigen BspA-like n=1 Tax=Trichomonas vaginalis (strain ATCC PRA-98 / G3) TaxID=412133 RepID=A2E8Y1_TRIV3|nr:ribonuclease inhibitor domain-containing protein [Trichomonas vaginalis G3]EAY10865.1 surface antigen BspA-like [Trichomonas vaginalis G3]KAI5482911.1 ribonuclease inhibitor domain-containing protein [Trichomonas vaginalis G3]|eukprot:XP_001323088.1 surface antigen BspA-like [Trichomonas vaginalis G3]
MSNLSSIFIPKFVESIYSNVFQDCTNLGNITIDPENENYKSDTHAIYTGADNSTLFLVGAAYTGEYTVANYVTKIYEYCFTDSKISSIKLHNGITTIQQYAFYACKSLSNITIPEGVKSIGYNALEYCGSLTTVFINGNISSIESYLFSECKSISSISIPESVTKIGRNAFFRCSSLTNISLPSSLQFIFDSAFSSICGRVV